MRRLLAAALGAAVLAGFLTGCRQSVPGDAYIYGKQTDEPSGSASENVKLTFLGFKADAMNLTAIEDAIHGFMEENSGIEVKYEGIKGSAYWEPFELRIGNGTMDDIVMIDHDRVLQYAPEGRLADLSGLSTIDGFNEMAKTQFTEKDGSIYFLPTAISTYGMYVNLDLLKENGFDVPDNWAEFSEQCDYFAGRGITPIIGNNYSTLRCLMSARGLYPVYRADDTAALLEAFNTGEADITEYLEAGVELVGTMLERGWFDREELKTTAQTSDDLELFARGDRPFMITGGWASRRLMAMDPQCEYAIYPLPVLEDGSVLVMNVDTCISVNAGSENLEEAMRFVEYLTQPDVIYEFCDSQSCYTPLADDRTPSDETIAPSAAYLFNGRNVIGADFRLKLPLDNAEMAVGEAMLDGMSTEEAIGLLSELIRQ